MYHPPNKLSKYVIKEDVLYNLITIKETKYLISMSISPNKAILGEYWLSE
jgi:hypothetical protein